MGEHRLDDKGRGFCAGDDLRRTCDIENRCLQFGLTCKAPDNQVKRPTKDVHIFMLCLRTNNFCAEVKDLKTSNTSLCGNPRHNDAVGHCLK
jgi:hypothetical protein